MKKKRYISLSKYRAYSLAEALVALMIASMVLITLFVIYGRVRSSTSAVTSKLEGYALPSEILQRMAEDIDRMTMGGTDVEISIQNKYQSGFHSAQLTIVTQVYDKDSKPQLLEKVVWQGNFDPESNSLVLYRSHSGLALEDKLFEQLDPEQTKWKDRQLFVPLCRGITFFEIQALQDEVLSDKWVSGTLPLGVVVTVSFGEPVESPAGGYVVAENEKYIRTVAIDRSKKMNFIAFEKDED